METETETRKTILKNNNINNNKAAKAKPSGKITEANTNKLNKQQFNQSSIQQIQQQTSNNVDKNV